MKGRKFLTPFKLSIALIEHSKSIGVQETLSLTFYRNESEFKSIAHTGTTSKVLHDLPNHEVIRFHYQLISSFITWQYTKIIKVYQST